MDGPTPVRTQEVLTGLHESRKEKEKDRGMCREGGGSRKRVDMIKLSRVHA